MGKSIGIDLGTTNSVVTWVNVMNAAPNVVQNRENEDLTPSVVSKKKDQVLVGSLATDYWKQSPKDTIFSIKRLMGRAFSDENVQKARQSVMYDIRQPVDGTDDDVRVTLGGREHSPIEISSMILRKLKGDTESRLGDTVASAVITVPAYFTDKQKDATRKAARAAGIKVKHILDEPSAAAIAFGFDNLAPEDSRTLLVYDLGGGTFDVSVLQAAGGTYVQLDIEGDMWLGGDDFDNRICTHILQKIRSEHHVDASADVNFMVELKRAAEKAKKMLSSAQSATIYIPGELKDGEGDLIDIEIDISRREFEQLIESEVRRSIDIVKTALENAKTTKDEIDSVLLVGGSSTIPLIRQSLIDLFGEHKVLVNIDPMRCVAQGAGILANKMADTIKCRSCNGINSLESDTCQTCHQPLEVVGDDFFQVTPVHYGIETVGDKFSVVIPKNTPFPMKEPVIKPFYTPESNIRRLKIRVYAGMREKASGNEVQMTLWLQLPPGVPVDTPLDVAFKLDDQGCINNVKVTLKDGSGRSVIAYPDRGEKRGRLEKEVDELHKNINRIRISADAEQVDMFEKEFDGIIDDLNNNRVDEADKKVRQLSIEIPRKTDIETVEWRKNADWNAWVTDAILANFGELLDADTTYGLRKKNEEVKKELEADNQSAGEGLTRELIDKIDALPDIVFFFFNSLAAGNIAANRGNIVIADRVRTLYRKIYQAHISNGPVSNAEVSELKRLTGDVLTESADGSRYGKGVSVPKELAGNRA